MFLEQLDDDIDDSLVFQEAEMGCILEGLQADILPKPANFTLEIQGFLKKGFSTWEHGLKDNEVQLRHLNITA